MKRLIRLFIFVSFFVLLSIPSLTAQQNLKSQENTLESNPPEQPPKQIKLSKPVHCIFGVFPAGLWDFDFAKKSFKISFYAWWKTKDPNYHPEKSVEITNATDYYSKFGDKGQNGDEYFSYVHYYATIQKNWNFKFFPFDRQILEVRMEDFADVNAIVFEPDYKASAIHDELIMPGWTINGLTLKNSVTHYKTNFGDSSVESGDYSRLTFLIDIKRQGWKPYFNYFIGFFISSFLSFMIFFVDIKNPNARVSLSLGGILIAVGNKYILDQLIPVTTYFTLVDALQTSTFLVIIASVFSIIFINWKFVQKSETVANWYNNRLCVIIFVSFVVFNGLWTLLAELS